MTKNPNLAQPAPLLNRDPGTASQRRSPTGMDGILRCIVLAFVAPCALIACSSHGLRTNLASVPPNQPGRPAQEWALRGQAMAATADPRATDAALEILAAGGSATDATIAAMAVLGLVEPQSAGLGGGGFWLGYDRKSGKMTFLDGRETAPAGATPDMFQENGKELSFFQAVASGRAIGTPGLVALWKTAHDRDGRLPWARNFEPAIRLAEQGFALTSRTANWLTRLAPRVPLVDNPDIRAVFFDAAGKPFPEGTIRTNPAYAATLRKIASEGPKGFYEGEIAQAIVTAAQAGPRAGTLALSDLKNYQVRERPVLCRPFRVYRVCTNSAPGSGTTVLEILGLYQESDQRDRAGGIEPDGSVDVWSRFIETSRAAYADRDFFFGDPFFVPVPQDELLDPAYLARRADVVQIRTPAAQIVAGDPHMILGRGVPRDQWGGGAPDPSTGTTHLSIVDGEGNAVSLTATIEGPFGSFRFTNGFFLNNQMTDFARTPVLDGKPVANAVQAGKTPRSSMSPAMVFSGAGQSDLYFVIGSPGGNSIVDYVAKTLIGVLELNLTTQDAINLPNIVARGDVARIEAPRADPVLLAGLKIAGRQIQEVQGEESGLHGIRVLPDGLEGGADPRRVGTAKSLKALPKPKLAHSAHSR